MSQTDDHASLLDLLKAARLVTVFVEGMDEAGFSQDAKAVSAVHYQLMIVGEAVKRLSEPFRGAHPGIPWKKISGMRDVLIHDYGDVDLGEVWRTATVAIPLLISQVEPLARGR